MRKKINISIFLSACLLLKVKRDGIFSVQRVQICCALTLAVFVDTSDTHSTISSILAHKSSNIMRVNRKLKTLIWPATKWLILSLETLYFNFRRNFRTNSKRAWLFNKQLFQTFTLASVKDRPRSYHFWQTFFYQNGIFLKH